MRQRASTAELLRVAELPPGTNQRLGLPGRCFTVQGESGPACIVSVSASRITDRPVTYCATHDAFKCAGIDRIHYAGVLTSDTAAIAAGALHG